MLSVLGAAGRRVGTQRVGLQGSLLGSQPPRRGAAGIVPRRRPLSTGGHQRLQTRAEPGGSGSNRGGVSSDASSPIPWTQELVDTLLEAVTKLGGPHNATPCAVLEAVKWPGLTEAQVAGFLQTLGVQALGAAAESVEPRRNRATGGRRETPKHSGNGERSRLHVLVAEGGLEELQSLLQQGSDPNGADSSGMTPLHEAAKSGNIECIRLLVQHGADLEARGLHYFTPLHVAAWYGQGAACKELVAQGASLGSRDSQGNTALMVGAQGDDDSGEGVRALVQLGASPNEWGSKDSLSATPLHAAALCGTVGPDRALLELGADVNAANTHGIRPLHSAAIGTRPGCLAVAQLLVQGGADVSARDNYGRTPLHWAAMRGKVPFIHFLLSAGANCATRDICGFTPAQLAAQEGQAEAKAVLNAAGKQGSHQGSVLVGTPRRTLPVDGGEAARQLSESGWSLDVLCTLLQQGLPPDTLAGDENGTLLHNAAAEGAAGAIRMLVHYGATLEYHDKTSGRTALHLAAGFRQPAACRELVALGANIDACNNSGTTPLMLAAALNESGDCVRVLVEAGANVFWTNAVGSGALDYAVRAGLLGPAKVLLEAGAAVSGSTRAEMTALHLAAAPKSPNAVAMVRLLLAAGMAVSAVDDDGMTPLHRAAMAGNAEVARVLLQAGARCDARDNKGRAPAQLAAQEGHAEVERLLRQAM
ncbi:hypothetical protein N2152v2_000751 [Parachlorella kessleri]